MKKIAILLILCVTVTSGLLVASKTLTGNSLLSTLAVDNLEALAQNENGLPDGWVVGRKMDQNWVEATASISASIAAGTSSLSTKVEGGITYVRMSCCFSATSADACNKPNEHSECENLIP